jgi:hypothetical protein
MRSTSGSRPMGMYWKSHANRRLTIGASSKRPRTVSLVASCDVKAWWIPSTRERMSQLGMTFAAQRRTFSTSSAESQLPQDRNRRRSWTLKLSRNPTFAGMVPPSIREVVMEKPCSADPRTLRGVRRAGGSPTYVVSLVSESSRRHTPWRTKSQSPPARSLSEYEQSSATQSSTTF